MTRRLVNVTALSVSSQSIGRGTLILRRTFPGEAIFTTDRLFCPREETRRTSEPIFNYRPGGKREIDRPRKRTVRIGLCAEDNKVNIFVFDYGE
jgi:hypothetical protein